MCPDYVLSFPRSQLRLSPHAALIGMCVSLAALLFLSALSPPATEQRLLLCYFLFPSSHFVSTINRLGREQRSIFTSHCELLTVSFSFLLFLSFSPPCSYTSVRLLWLFLSCGFCFCFCFMCFFFRFFHLSSTFCCCFGALEKASLFCNRLECKHFCMHIVLLLLLLYFGFVPLLLQVEDVCC